jgi:hypothetical protein
MALRREPTQVEAAPDWPVSTLSRDPPLNLSAGSGPAGPEPAGPGPAGPLSARSQPIVWPTLNLAAGAGQEVMTRPSTWAGGADVTSPSREEPGPAREPAEHAGVVASLQARSLGQLVGGAIAVGFVFIFAASVVTAFARIPGQGVRARLLVAFNYSTFLTAVALLFGLVCLLLLGRSTARGGLAPVSTGSPLNRPAKQVIAAVLAAESALVGLGSLISFVLYLSVAGGLPAAGVGHMLAELAVLPVVAITLLWGWSGGTVKLRRLFGVGSPAPLPQDELRMPVPPTPPSVPSANARPED